MKARTAKIERKTHETDIVLELDLDGTGRFTIDTGIGFLDHLLTHIAKHGRMDMKIKAKGDKNILKDIENYALNYEHYLQIRKELDALRGELAALRKGVAPMDG